MTTLQCNIVIPTESVFQGAITYASVPAWDGQLGVMSGQSPVLTRLGTGVLRLDTEEGSRWFMIAGGFAQVQGSTLTVLADQARSSELLSLEEAQAELAEANARITRGADDLDRVTADQARARATIATIQSASARA